MSEKVYLGVDLGAESGRVMAGCWDGKQMRLEELHRFPNTPVSVADSLRWDILRLWGEIQNGLAIGARKHGKSVVSVGVDTWGVDFVLLSKSNELLGQPYHYRDARTRGQLALACQRVPRAEIFAATGIQFMEINTLYQLLALQARSPELLEMAETFLTIPDYLNWCLSGARVSEFTIASTTQCLNPLKRNWAHDLLDRFELPKEIFPEIVFPGSRVGVLREAARAATGLGAINVVAPATHDTGSAVAAVPTERTGKPNWAYLSSGTWSLLGVEVSEAIVTERSLALNVTNEGGVNSTFRLLENIMGLWLVQQCRKAFEARGTKYDYADLTRLAADAGASKAYVDPDDPSFLNPADMPAAIQNFCRETGQPVPDADGAIVRCALESLALKYSTVLGWLEELAGNPIEVIHIVGGGSQNKLLNQLAANACDRQVVTGPIEATVLGNVLVQAWADCEIKGLPELRSVVRESSALETYDPDTKARGKWKEAREIFAGILAARKG